MGTPRAPPLVCHIVYRFDTGGLENGVVNLINHMPSDAVRHVVVALTEINPAFAARVHRPGVDFLALNKAPGHGVKLLPKVASLLRKLRPAVVHTRNLAALELQPAATWAGVPLRVHGEHGRDVEDMYGTSRRHQWMRRAFRPFVHRYVALSRDLRDYLVQKVGIPPQRVVQIYNGVDTQRFAPAHAGRGVIEGCPFTDRRLWLAGTVGRMQTVKAQPLLARAFALALQQQPHLRERMRLVLVGDGPLRAEAESVLAQAGLAELAWLPGERSDVAQVMRGLDAFVLPSMAEGVSNTILEAMASGLPVLATDVGGNGELVQHARTGLVVPAQKPEALARCLVELAQAPEIARRMGQLGRERAVEHFSLQAMVAGYLNIYRPGFTSAGLGASGSVARADSTEVAGTRDRVGDKLRLAPAAPAVGAAFDSPSSARRASRLRNSPAGLAPTASQWPV